MDGRSDAERSPPFNENTPMTVRDLVNMKDERLFSALDLRNPAQHIIEVLQAGEKPLPRNPESTNGLLPVRQTVRSRAVFSNAIAAAAARIPERPLMESRTSILKGPAWTIQPPQQSDTNVTSFKSFKKINIIPARPIKTEPYFGHRTPRNLSDTRGLSDPAAEISLFDEEQEDEPIEELGDDWVDQDNVQIDPPEFVKITKGKRKQPMEDTGDREGPMRPGWSYSCLIALALKNSPYGYLTVSEIYAFIMYYFPFFRKAPDGWRNSVRHNLSLNKCFSKLEPNEPASNKRCSYWMITPSRIEKINADIRRWRERNPDPRDASHGLAFPEFIDDLEAGTKGMPPMDDKQRPLYAAMPPGNNMQEDPLRMRRDFADDFSEGLDTGSPLFHPYVEHENDAIRLAAEFAGEQMFFNDSPLMDHIHDERAMDGPHYSRKSFFSSPLKDETNQQRRILSPILDLDNSYQGQQYNHCMGAFDSAVCALNDNSLLQYSPPNQKDPTTFPDKL